MIIVPDTNTLVSATFWTGDSFRIMELIDNGKIKCVLSKDILQEYSKVLHSDEIAEKVEKKAPIISRVIRKVISDSVIVEPKRKHKAVEDDPDDDKFIDAAVEGKCDFIVTQDKHLLKIEEFKGIKTIHPKDFIRMFL